MADGTVTLSLDQYESMQDELRALRSKNTELKKSLEEEKLTTWRIFGPLFSPSKKLSTFHEVSYANFEERIVLRNNVPYTQVTFQGWDYMNVPDKSLIIRHLIEHHITDVIKSFDFTGLEQWLSKNKKK